MPFETIMTFIQKFDSMYSTSQVMLNLFGNVCAFMPMAFFLPLLFKKQNKFRYFVITMVLMILGIEFLQLVTGSGRFDVDDLILNLSGAVCRCRGEQDPDHRGFRYWNRMYRGPIF